LERNGGSGAAGAERRERSGGSGATERRERSGGSSGAAGAARRSSGERWRLRSGYDGRRRGRSGVGPRG